MKSKSIIIMTFALVTVVGAILAPIPFGGHAVFANTTTPAQSNQTQISVVVDGLHSPRGLAFGPGNILYIAEAGDETHTGSIMQVENAMSQNPTKHTIVANLPTTGDEGEFLGASGISVLGRGTN